MFNYFENQLKLIKFFNSNRIINMLQLYCKIRSLKIKSNAAIQIKKHFYINFQFNFGFSILKVEKSGFKLVKESKFDSYINNSNIKQLNS